MVHVQSLKSPTPASQPRMHLCMKALEGPLRIGLKEHDSFLYLGLDVVTHFENPKAPDTSPFELSALTRWDPAPGLRVRTGFVLPIFVWASWMPPDRPPGVSESTWILDLSIAL